MNGTFTTSAAPRRRRPLSDYAFLVIVPGDYTLIRAFAYDEFDEANSYAETNSGRIRHLPYTESDPTREG